MTRKRVYTYLFWILAAALGVRVWGIWFGLPFSYRADEYHEVFRALELGSGGFNLERTGKGGYFYLLFVEYGVLFVSLKIAGLVDSAQDFARYFFRDPSTFYLIGRATTAVIGALNVLLLYRLGARAYSVGAGLLAAVFLAFDFLNTQHSHFITVDVPMTCLVTSALLFAVRMVTNGCRSDYKWAALVAALATTTKVPAILLGVPLLIAHYFFVRREGGGPRQLFLSPNLWWAIGIFAVVLAVTNPGILVNPPLRVIFGDAAGSDIELADEDEFSDIMPTAAPNLFMYYSGVLVDSMGWPLLLVAISGALYALRKRTPADIMFLSFGAIYFLVFSTNSNLYYPRYMLPLIAVLVILAARVLCAVWPRAGAIRQGVAVLAITSIVFLPAYRSIANDILLTHTDTRTIAKEWIEANIPAGSRVFIEGLRIEPSRLTVPLQDSARNMRENIEYYRTREPGKVKYLEFKLQVMPEVTYDLELVKRSELGSFAYYKDAGVQYFVIRPETFAYSPRVGAAGPAFLGDLRSDPDVSLIKSIRSLPGERPGPDIDIYRINSNITGEPAGSGDDMSPGRSP